jgi:hypothetical protein
MKIGYHVILLDILMGVRHLYVECIIAFRKGLKFRWLPHHFFQHVT